MDERFVNKVLLVLLAMTIFMVSCAKALPEPEPPEVKEDVQEIIQGMEQPTIIQEYPLITTADLEALSESQGEAIDEGQSQEAAEETPEEDEWLAEPSEEEVIDTEVYIEETAEEYFEEDIEEGIEMTDESEDDGWIYMGAYQITAYEETGNPCANGNYPTIGYTAACNSLPFGTTVYIEGIGYRVIEDRGAEWHSDQWIDVYMGYVWDCNQFGVQYLDVWIVE